MVLYPATILELLKNPAAKAQIADALAHEERVKLHTKAVDKKDKAPRSFTRFLEWVKDEIKLPVDKFNAFEALCKFPLPTTGLCNSIFEEYEKIFQAQDPYYAYQLLDDTLQGDFKEYIETTLNVRRYFETKGFEEYRTQFNCLYVVDMPAEQDPASPWPAPYFYKVPISSVVDIGTEYNVDNTRRVGYLIFLTSSLRAVQIDDQYYRVLEKVKEGDQWRITSEAIHGLGYTPARFFASQDLYDPLEDKNHVAKKITVSGSVGDLDWLLFFQVAGRCFEIFGPFPIFTVPETDCDFVDVNKNHCQHGMVSYVNSRDGSAGSYACPVCTKNNLVGPGTLFTRPTPKTKEDPQLPAAVEITAAPVESLQWIADRIDFYQWEVYANCVGSDDQVPQKEAINEKQVQTNVESKRNVLMRIKRDFETMEKFIIDTIGRLQYGDYYVDSTVSLGEQFLLYTAREVTDQYATYKKTGLPTHMVAKKRELLVQTEFKNNPYEKQRSDLLDHLEPWADYSLTECQTYMLDQRFPEKFLLKLNFPNFVQTFERKNGDIVSWGSALSLDDKINKLTQIFTDYAREEFKQAKQIQPQGQPKLN